MSLKDKISDEIKSLTNDNISIISMRIFYIISEKLLEINLNEKFNHSENKIYNISSLCSDNIENVLNNLKNKNTLSNDELTDMVYKLIITNLKYI
tara:strand:+ start:6809 stop:7093 length:285 start_codon:yes stop_codon:yes gene_type:complete